MVIFLYIVFSVYSYATRQEVKFYEVPEGTLVRQTSFTGIAIREEQAVNAEKSGYVHFYIQQGKRAAVGSNVYTMDETGSLEAYLSDHPELSSEMTDDEIRQVKYSLSSFSKTFDNLQFLALYDLKYSMDASALEYAGLSSATDLDSILSKLGISFSRISTDTAGIISYSTDGDEQLVADDVTSALFDLNNYKQTVVKPGDMVEAGKPVYRLITSDHWQLVFSIENDMKEILQDKKKLSIHFLSEDLSTDADFNTMTGKDGTTYGILSMHEFMEIFAEDRFISFEIRNTDNQGLKIPVSAITKKDFFIIPKDFLATGDGGENGFYRQTTNEAGVTGSEFVPTEIYRMDDQYCYINIPTEAETNALKLNEFILRESDGTAYRVGPVKSLDGVYNINKGYCIFRQIVPIEQNADYMIVQENTEYGISVYDHIVLNAASVKEGQVVYQ